DRLAGYLAVWREEGFAPIRQQWLDRSYPVGAAIRANAGGQPVVGLFAGLDPDGALLLDTPAGCQRIVAGEIVATGG
ncbi:MAG: BirA family transcriptional regulator, partial [Acetobacteraceae bacterium]|nr:BirA family transcriptional regulator [Acetobacteraceae bacterium]